MVQLKTPVSLCLLLFFITFHLPLAGQAIIQGSVVDHSGKPLIGVTLLLVGTTNGTLTDVDGKYRLEVPPGKKRLMASYTGFQTMEKRVLTEADSVTVVDFILQPGTVELSEVVIGSVRKKAKAAKSSKKRGMAAVSVLPEITSGVDYERSDKPSGTRPADELAVEINAGTLTAGEIHDFSKWDLWGDIVETDLQSFQKTWESTQAAVSPYNL